MIIIGLIIIAILKKLALPSGRKNLDQWKSLVSRIRHPKDEVDIALVYGLGFPPFRGGVFRWADATGSASLLKAAQKHAALGALYAPTKQLRDLAASGKGFHGE